MTLESKIEKECCKWAKTQGIDNRKLTSEVGDPDRIFLCKGNVLFVEFKAPGKVGRAIQLHRHIELEKQGFLALVIDDLEVFKQVIKIWLNL